MFDAAAFIKRLESLLDHYELSAAAFADRIDVQRSSISHLLKGRNKPSLEFVLKINEAFSEVDLQWLLYGKGIFPSSLIEGKTTGQEKRRLQRESTSSDPKAIERIIVFYSDGTFKNYTEQ